MNKHNKKINDKTATAIKNVIPMPDGTAYTITCEDKVAYLRKIDLRTYAKVIPMLAPTDSKTSDIVAAGEIILRGCFIGGDQEFLTDDDFTLAGALQAVSLVQLKEATLKKS